MDGANHFFPGSHKDRKPRANNGPFLGDFGPLRIRVDAGNLFNLELVCILNMLGDYRFLCLDVSQWKPKPSRCLILNETEALIQQ